MTKEKEEKIKKEDEEMSTSGVVVGTGIVLVAVLALYFYFNKQKDKDLSPKLDYHKKEGSKSSQKDELSEDEKRKIRDYLESYEQEVKHAFVERVGLDLFLSSKILDNLEKKYSSDGKFDPLSLTKSVDLDKPSVEQYLLDLAKEKFGVYSKEELLKKERYVLGALKELIKEKAYKEILKEIEPYVEEEKREKFENLKDKMPPIFM